MNKIEAINQLKELREFCLKEEYYVDGQALDIAIEVLQVECTKVPGKDKKSELESLEEICKPVAEYLKNNYDPHCTIIITDTQIKLVRDELAIPVKTAPEVPAQEQSVISLNRLRAKHGLDPIQGGDVYFIPIKQLDNL